MKPDDFEQRLSRQPLRQISLAWRGEILAAARDAQAACHPSPATRHNWLGTFNQQLSTIFWPHPKAWAGLAAVWMVIFAVQFSLRDESPRRAEKSSPLSPEVLVELRQQQLMLAELIGSRETQDADRPRNAAPKPRGARTEILVG